MEEASNVDSLDENKTSPPLVLKYVRRLDRTPDKDFHLLSEEEKKRTCFSRSLVEKVKKKITKLEDEVDERTKEVEKERFLRKQAEELLRYKDMYKNPEVNQELRDRLPRSNKSDPFKKEEVTETDNSSIEEEIVVEEENQTQSVQQPKMDADTMKSIESQIIRDGDVRPKTAPPVKRNLTFSDEALHSHNSSPIHTGQYKPTSLTPPPHGYYGHTLGASSYMPYTGHFLPNGAYHSPLLHSSSVFPQSTMYRPMSTPTLHTNNDLHTSPIAQRLSQTFSAPMESSGIKMERNPNLESSSKEPSGASGGYMSPERSPERSAEAGIGSSSNLSGSRTFLPGQRSPLQTSVLPDPFIPNISSRLTGAGSTNYGTEYSRHIMSLLNEIDLQRTEKKKMMERLAEKEQELETLKLTMKATGAEAQASASETDKAAGLVQEVYAAQKKRDEAVNGRLKQANEERDDVMARLSELERRLDTQSGAAGYTSSEDGQQLDIDQIENEDFHFFLSQMDSPSSAENESSALVHKIEAMRQQQREVTNEEMQIVMDQRDIALAKCKKLEAELLHYQKQLDADGGTDKLLKAKLTTVQQERDLAVAKSKQLDQEIQTLRLYYSLHKSLSPENSLQQSTNDTLHAYEEELSAVKLELSHAHKGFSFRDLHKSLSPENSLQQSTNDTLHAYEEELSAVKLELSHAHKENQHLVSQVRANTIDKKQLQEALEAMKQDKEMLQRLATVLKRKLNSMNNNPPEEEDE